MLLMRALIISAVIVISISLYFLNKGLDIPVEPAPFACLYQGDGDLIEHYWRVKGAPTGIYGIGLSYAKHINETASDFIPDAIPPVFIKSTDSFVSGDSDLVRPDHAALLSALKKLEPSLENMINEREIVLDPLLDYEVELGMVLLENLQLSDLLDQQFAPALGFFVANDLSARSVAILGEGQTERYAYWGISKSYTGFSPMSEHVWVPSTHKRDSVPCVTLETYVDDERRQHESTESLVYTSSQMLRFIMDVYDKTQLPAGTVILTGTPGGVTLNVPRWKSRLAKLFGFDRWTKLSLTQSETNRHKYLQPGSEVRVEGEWLGKVSTVVQSPQVSHDGK